MPARTDDVAIRPVRDDELLDVAALRWRWSVDGGVTPATSRKVFLSLFLSWAREHVAHSCLVAVRDDKLLGMAWLAVVPRVPSVASPERASGDVQCVYVVPEERDAGIGGQLIDAVLELAAAQHLERVTVHSSERAITMYGRHGFLASPCVLDISLT